MRDFAQERLNMVAEQLRRRGLRDERVLAAMTRVPRHLFVPAEARAESYEDRPLAIGEGQTISQPYMVAVMTQTLELTGEERILEIGTGSGYQTAVLAELAREVYTVERLRPLFQNAESRLRELGYGNIRCRLGDGSQGWPEEAPFEGILVTAGAPEVPEALKDQLSPGGRLVIPVGSRYSQNLLKIRRAGMRYEEEEITGCVFVPLVGESGWREA